LPPPSLSLSLQLPPPLFSSARCQNVQEVT
jgi:hypothetical protein